MALNAYSSYATYLSNIAGVKNLQTSLAELTQQLNSGKKSSNLVTYGVQGARLLDLRAEIQRREGYAQSAVNDLDHYQEKIEIARNLTNDALAGIRALHADNTVNDAVITATSLSHQTSINLYTDGTDKIEGVDNNEVAAKLDLAQTQLQAIFAVIGTTNQISLVNFLA